ncbi:MAG: epimerase [Chthonomonadales bacterium]|nr:epimerase [Chthonomonadales bacterium]
MDLLVLGGTLFLGRHIVEDALRRDWRVTLFNRGQHNPDLFPGVERITGDRDGGLDGLTGRAWDAVVDTSGYVPRVVAASARLLARSVGHYAFVSTVSVYADFRREGMGEAAPVGVLDDDSVETVDDATYGPLKALCEGEVERALPGRALIVRPGLIVGPHDPSDRFTYWPLRVAGGGEVLAPGAPDGPVQVIDARDLAAWVLDMAAGGRVGVFNAVGPDVRLTLGEVLDTCREVSGSDARFTWVPEDFVLEQGLRPWADLPLWLPRGSGEYVGLDTVSNAAAVAAGLRFRPLAETARDTLAWACGRPRTALRVGITRERERELLNAWRAASYPI